MKFRIGNLTRSSPHNFNFGPIGLK